MDAATSLPPVDVMIGLLGILAFGVILGALISLPILQRRTKMPLERLSGDLIWRYNPDYIVAVTGCLIFLILSFVLVSGWMRIF